MNHMESEAEKAARKWKRDREVLVGYPYSLATVREAIEAEQDAAFLDGVKWTLRKAEEIANAPENGMATEEVAFVEQLRSILKDPNAR